METLRVNLRLPDDVLDTAVERDLSAMATHIRADMESQIAERIAEKAADKVLCLLADMARMSPTHLITLMEFLAHDEEIQNRFTAYCAARRILHDKPY